MIKAYFYLKNDYSFLIDNFVLSSSTIYLNCLLLLYVLARRKNQNKKIPECKNHRMSLHRIKIGTDHMEKNGILNIFIRTFKKKLLFIVFSQLEFIKPNQLSRVDYKHLPSTP